MSKNNTDNQWNMLVHLSSLSGYIGVPLGNVLGPLIVWQIKKNEIPEIDTHGKDALNFNLSMLLYLAVLTVFSLLVITLILTIPMIVIAVILHIIFTIKAALAARDGKEYKYPLTITFIM